MSRAKNLSIRVPWQDNGWRGFICTKPKKNISCLNLRSIAERRDLDFECLLAEKEISQLSEEEITEKLKNIIADTGASGAKHFGKVMPVAMQELKGKADGKLIQTILKKLLEN